MKALSRLALVASAFFGVAFAFLPVSAVSVAPRMSFPANMKDARITEYFGWYHTGIDIAPLVREERLPVLAAAGGSILSASACEQKGSGCNGGYGNMVVIKHANGYRTRYAHLDRVDAKVGDHVVAGQSIGTMGNTGRVSNPKKTHLHFEVIRDVRGSGVGVRSNPLKVLPARSGLGSQKIVQ